MARDFSASGFDYSTLEPLTTLQEQVVVLLLDAVHKLADAGKVARPVASRSRVSLVPMLTLMLRRKRRLDNLCD